jgi:hypothetical protein
MDFLTLLLTFVVLTLLLVLVIAPFESLRWWSGWVSDNQADQEDRTPPKSSPAEPLPAANAPDQYVVFLPGVGALGTQVDPWEQSLVDVLLERLRGGTVLSGLFPFTVREDTLTQNRHSAWFWRWLERVRESRAGLVAHLIDWRNLTQVFVSMDPRYGPIYNKGIEEKLVALLRRQGYVVGDGTPIALIGYSGGAQISLGASLYLAHDLRAPVTVISLGGVIGDDPALETVTHLYHLWATKDLEEHLARMIVPTRWAMSRRSRWNQAIAAQRVTLECLGAMTHCGPTGYLDAKTFAPDGRSYLEVTTSAMLRILDAGVPAKLTPV